jgi:hypothetical protein
MSDPVAAAVTLTFEEMAFLDVAPGPARQPPPPEDGPWLALSYTRPRPGSLALFLPKAVKFAVAEGIYGESWDALHPGQLDDSLLELMNVLAGRLLTGRYGTGAPCSMGLPTLLYDPPEQPRTGLHRFVFHTDNDELVLLWHEAVS